MPVATNVTRLRTGRHELLRLVRGQNRGRAAWWLVRIDPLKYPLYQRALCQAILNITDFGEIIECGFGEYAASPHEKPS